MTVLEDSHANTIQKNIREIYSARHKKEAQSKPIHDLLKIQRDSLEITKKINKNYKQSFELLQDKVIKMDQEARAHPVLGSGFVQNLAPRGLAQEFITTQETFQAQEEELFFKSYMNYNKKDDEDKQD